jgi:hypothetical protein
LDQCLRHGPRGLDAAVFLLAQQLDLTISEGNAEYSNYAKRLDNSRDLRVALAPILAELRPRQQTK